MVYVLFSSVLLLWSICGFVSADASDQIVNKNVERSIDLTSQLVRLTATLTLENLGKTVVNEYLIVPEPNQVGHISYLNAKDALKNELRIQSIELQGRKVFKVILSNALEPGRTTSITIEEIITKGLVSYPSSITQKEKQLVRYFGNHYFYSPYVTTKQRTEVVVSSKSIENYSKLKPVSQSDSLITYGPYSNIAPLTESQMIVHYENNAPFLTITKLDRNIDVSHWGNIGVEENVEIHHTGAKLKGSFSRYDYQRDMSSTHHSVKSYRTILPVSAHSIYYRDSNGNISTSTVRQRKEWIELELKPRYPLFGGWRSSYTLGYNVPNYQYLFKKSSGEYVLSLRLLDHVFDDMHVEELTTSVVLPVGVSNIKVDVPYEAERLPDGVTYKYLDTIGRIVIKLEKTDLVEQHIQDLTITYNWQPHLLLHEPVLLSIALFLLFVVVIIYVRLDFSLDKPEHVKKD